MTAAEAPTLAGVLPAWLDDVDARIDDVRDVLRGRTASGVLWQATRRRFLLEVPGVARYLAADGRSLRADPAPDAPAAEVARFARSTPLAALCYQRGMLVFHAAAATRHGSAVLLAGDSSAGKSTLLGELLGRGWRMLGDDLAPVMLDERGAPTVMPTHPDLVLWADASQRLPAGDHLVEVDRAAGGRGVFRTLDRVGAVPLPLRAVWWLSAHNRHNIEVEAVTGVDAFAALGGMAYNRRIAYALLEPAAYLRIAGAAAASISLRRLRRPRGEWNVGRLADLIEADAVSAGGSGD
jgi:hypothetical protein